MNVYYYVNIEYLSYQLWGHSHEQERECCCPHGTYSLVRNSEYNY